MKGLFLDLRDDLMLPHPGEPAGMDGCYVLYNKNKGWIVLEGREIIVVRSD